MKRRIATAALLAPLLAVAEPPVVTKESATTFYRDFKRLTETPRYVAPLTAMLCLIPPKEVLDKESAMTGPHTREFIHLYASRSAADTITSNEAEFPEGAILVKEKLRRDAKITGIGGMIKRAKGYDPRNGDWEFFFFTPGGDFTTGRLANCIGCHNGGKRDHVFSVWNLAKR